MINRAVLQPDPVRVLGMAADTMEAAIASASPDDMFLRLEEAGVIQGYGARVSPAALGLPLTVYVRVRPMPGQLRKVAEVLGEIEAVVECDRVTGEDCFVAKAHVRSVEELLTERRHAAAWEGASSSTPPRS